MGRIFPCCRAGYGEDLPITVKVGIKSKPVMDYGATQNVPGVATNLMSFA